ncbi:unnamed protein product, partial [Vitis vinifera]|uniref:Uncharacterized protein n=1 Tax=Vitis vinifera TaxID=29760 RepID=D7T9C6_VITVI
MGAGGKAFLILCILLSIPSEALVVSDTLKPPQALHIVRHIIESRRCGAVCPSNPVHAPKGSCRPAGKHGCGRPPAP